MNSRDRRRVERAWPHGVYIYEYMFEECFDWLNTNFGSCRWQGKHNPRWCWRPDMVPGPNFSVYREGASVYFRKERDYLAFLLRWS
jgi:hypothetical protein